jgi:ABC-2 type transport system permease protein
MSAQDSDVALQKPSQPFWELVKVQGKLVLREPYSIIFGVAMPILLLIIFGSVPTFREPISSDTTMTVFDLYIPILMVTVLIMIGLLGLPIPIVRDREIGWLRRISTTPISPTKLLTAQVTINIILAAVGFVILVVGSSLIFGVNIVLHIPGFFLSIALATMAMFSLGILIAAVAPSQGAANGMMMALLYPLLFFAGVYVPMQVLPSSLQTVASFTPVGAAVKALESSMQGTFPSIIPLLVMTAYTAFFSYIAIRYFRWE